MRVIYLARPAPRGPLNTLLRLALGVLTAGVLLVIAFFSLVVVLPLMLLGGIALYIYLRRKRSTILRQAQSAMRPERDVRPEPGDDIIDAEYTVIERRE